MTNWYIGDPKSNVLDLSNEPTNMVLRPSTLEEPGEYGKEGLFGNPRWEVECWAKEKHGTEVIGGKIGYRWVAQAHAGSFRSGRLTMEWKNSRIVKILV